MLTALGHSPTCSLRAGMKHVRLWAVCKHVEGQRWPLLRSRRERRCAPPGKEHRPRDGRGTGRGKGTTRHGHKARAILANFRRPCSVEVGRGALTSDRRRTLRTQVAPSRDMVAPWVRVSLVTLLLHLLQKKVLHGRLLRQVRGHLPFAVDDAHAGSVAEEVPVQTRPELTPSVTHAFTLMRETRCGARPV